MRACSTLATLLLATSLGAAEPPRLPRAPAQGQRQQHGQRRAHALAHLGEPVAHLHLADRLAGEHPADEVDRYPADDLGKRDRAGQRF